MRLLNSSRPELELTQIDTLNLENKIQIIINKEIIKKKKREYFKINTSALLVFRYRSSYHNEIF